MNPIRTYVDAESGVIVKVYPPKKRKEKTRIHCDGTWICRTSYKEITEDKISKLSMSMRAKGIGN